MVRWFLRYFNDKVKDPGFSFEYKSKNVYGLWEWAGAFGDLGTLIPFVVAYIAVMKLEPAGVLMAFAVSKIAVGFFYKIPIPVQPMKAIGTAAVTQVGTINPAMLYGSGIVTALIWLIIGFTNTTRFLTRITARPVVLGIVLGLGLLFIGNGVKMVLPELWLGGVCLALTLVLLWKPTVPAMFVLLLFGAFVALWQNPRLYQELSKMVPHFQLPSLNFHQLSWQGIVGGTLLLALPQMPLTLGNAIIAITAESNHLFPQHPVSERKLALSTGFMNLFSAFIGGVPLCHGAGGMAGHVRFGARTGGALVILGGLLLIMALFFSDSVEIIFGVFPQPVLGVILLVAGIELARTAWDRTIQRKDLIVLGLTAGLVLWNMLAGFIGGIILYYLLHRNNQQQPSLRA